MVMTLVMEPVSFMLGYRALRLIFVLSIYSFFFFVALCALGHRNGAVIQ